jgi:hypothetical protein
MLFVLPGHQFPYIVMNRCLYLSNKKAGVWRAMRIHWVGGFMALGWISLVSGTMSERRGGHQSKPWWQGSKGSRGSSSSSMMISLGMDRTTSLFFLANLSPGGYVPCAFDHLCALIRCQGSSDSVVLFYSTPACTILMPKDLVRPKDIMMRAYNGQFPTPCMLHFWAVGWIDG